MNEVKEKQDSSKKFLENLLKHLDIKLIGHNFSKSEEEMVINWKQVIDKHINLNFKFNVFILPGAKV